MRSIVIGLCLLAAACGGNGVTSPASPTSTNLARPALTPAESSPAQAAQVQNAHASGLPFSGWFDIRTRGTVNCPPTCPPTTFVVSGTVNGTATHLGRFTGTADEVVDLATLSGVGTFTFMAANGDQLFTTTVGQGDPSTPPDIAHITETATIVGGTGRFEGATGTLFLDHTSVIEGGTAATGSGTVQGHINLAR